MNLVRLIYSPWTPNLCHFGRPNRVLGPVHEKLDIWTGPNEAPYGNNTDVSGYMTGSVIILIKSNTEVR